jgi:hypothetical protein
MRCQLARDGQKFRALHFRHAVVGNDRGKRAFGFEFFDGLLAIFGRYGHL